MIELEPWQAEAVAKISLPVSYDDVDPDVWRGMIGTMAFGAANEDQLTDAEAALWRRLSDYSSLAFAAGLEIGRLLKTRPDTDDTAESSSADIIERLEREMKPDIPSLHRETQAALLRAIETAAKATDDVWKLGALADAYLRLPAPGEDV